MIADRYTITEEQLTRFTKSITVVDHKTNKTYRATKDGLCFSAATGKDIDMVKKVLQLKLEGK